MTKTHAQYSNLINLKLFSVIENNAVQKQNSMLTPIPNKITMNQPRCRLCKTSLNSRPSTDRLYYARHKFNRAKLKLPLHVGRSYW